MPNLSDALKTSKKSKRMIFRSRDLRDILAFSDKIECSSIANESHLFDDIHVVEDIQRRVRKN